MSNKFSTFATELETILSKYNGLLEDLEKSKSRRLHTLFIVGNVLVQGDKMSKEDKAELAKVQAMKKNAASLGIPATVFDKRISELTGGKVARAQKALTEWQNGNKATSARIENDIVLKFSMSKAIFRFVYEHKTSWQVFTVNIVTRTVQEVLTSADVSEKLPNDKTADCTSKSRAKKIAKVLLDSGLEQVVKEFISETPFQGVNAGGLGGIVCLNTTATKWLASAKVNEHGQGTLPVETVYTPEKSK